MVRPPPSLLTRVRKNALRTRDALPGRDVPFRAFALALYDRVRRDNLSDYAASIAYSAVLAIFPFLLFVVALASVVVDPKTVRSLIDEPVAWRRPRQQS